MSQLNTNTILPQSGNAVVVGSSGSPKTLKIIDLLHLDPSTAPGTPLEGDIYYDSATSKLKCYNGAIWNDLF